MFCALSLPFGGDPHAGEHQEGIIRPIGLQDQPSVTKKSAFI
jgi:hypothetical protein